TDLELAGDDEPLRAVFIRAPWIEDAGPGVEVLAEVDGRPVLAREGRFLVAAFHPELTDDTRLHELFLELARSSNRNDARRRGALGACDARTQGAPIAEAIGATEDAAARVPSAPSRHRLHSGSSSEEADLVRA